MYFISIVFFLSALSFYELGKNRSCHEVLYLFVLLVMTLLLCFRFGQGTDYYSYYDQFVREVDETDSYSKNSLSHGEYGWYFLYLTTKKLGLPFEFLVALVSIGMMISVYQALKLSPYKMTSLLLFFPTYYMTYCCSGMRQGLTTCLFLGFGLRMLLEKKTFKFCLLIIGMSMIHSSSIILITLPLLEKFKERQLNVLMVLAFIGSFMISRISFVRSLMEGPIGAYLEAEFSIGAFAIRAIMFFFIWSMHHLGNPKDSDLFREECLLFRLYILGFILFLALSFFGILSQRLSMPLKAIEVVLIPLLFYRNRNYLLNWNKTRVPQLVLYMVALVLMMNFECYKNINSYIDQRDYREWVTPMNYPYVSVFDEERIWQYTYSL